MRQVLPNGLRSRAARAIAGTALALATMASSARADEVRIALPDRSQLVLQVPDGWNRQLKLAQPPLASATPASALPAIHFAPREGSAFRLVVTPLWRDDLNMPLPTADHLRTRVRVAADAATARSVERQIPVQDFSVPGVHGSYFSATDRAPAAGDYARMAQGIVGFGEIGLAFTLLSNDDPAPLLATTLQVLGGVRRDVAVR